MPGVGSVQAILSKAFRGPMKLVSKMGLSTWYLQAALARPPAVPPREYWNVDLRNPHGHMQATDWFAGYRHGAQLAREEGYRERALVPSSLFLFGQQGKCSKGPGCQCQACQGEVTNYTVEEQSAPELMLPQQQEPAVEAALPETTLLVDETVLPPLPGSDLPVEKESLPLPLQERSEETPLEETPLEETPLEETSPAKPAVRSPDVDDIFDSSAAIPNREPSKELKQPIRQVNFVTAARQAARARQVVVGASLTQMASPRAQSVKKEAVNKPLKNSTVHNAFRYWDLTSPAEPSFNSRAQ